MSKGALRRCADEPRPIAMVVLEERAIIQEGTMQMTDGENHSDVVEKFNGKLMVHGAVYLSAQTSRRGIQYQRAEENRKSILHALEDVRMLQARQGGIPSCLSGPTS